ncbi:MAG: alanine--tRNA ligase [Candidatus Omnitrophota bacterium]
MRKLSSDEIRELYLKFFESKGHKLIASDALVPKNDPTVLFTSAGMNQFKEQFLGKNITFKRATTCQKCLRTDDLDKVGKTPVHHTFFEMLGNFSFGDYFKEDAITWAWEFMTKTLAIAKDRLWVSVYKDDDEAYKIWSEKIKIPSEKILKLGEKENFWPSEAPTKGPNGLCGPCSEIFYDQGKQYGCGKPSCDPSCACGRFAEVWNLVFTQFERVGVNELAPLPSKNIDTGMGLERIAAVMQGVYANFETDIFKPLIDELTKQIGIEHPAAKFGGSQSDAAVYAIADHIRAVTFAICDNVMPSNEERGYVVRKLIRKAAWLAQGLGMKEPFLYKVVPVIAKVMLEPYPELTQRRENISNIVLAEEKKFRETLEAGQVILQEIIDSLKKKNVNVIDGESVFKLHDTYGFPVELTAEIAKENGLSVDSAGYDALMAKQKERAKGASAILQGEVFTKGPAVEAKTEFLGYDALECSAKILAILKDNKPVGELHEKEKGVIILDNTVFYPESGGQVGDRGEITTAKAKATVTDTKNLGTAIAHYVEISAGSIKPGDDAKAQVDVERRQDIMRNHTATHLLQSALRKVLGEHVHQAGSLVDAQRLRFDFTHFAALDERTLERVEALVNEKIMLNDAVNMAHMPTQEAIKTGAIALFGEKYGENVRVVKAGESKELCGGTHVKLTAEIGLFKIVGETAVQSGVRRIEARTGRWARKSAQEDETQINEIAKMLKTTPDKIEGQLENLIARVKLLEREITSLGAKKIYEMAQSMFERAKDINGTKLIIERLDGAGEEMLRKNIDLLREKAKSGIFILCSKQEDRAIFVCAVTEDLLKRNIKAPELLNKIAKLAGGSGGGRPNLAIAGAKDLSKLDEALAAAPGIAKEELKK